MSRDKELEEMLQKVREDFPASGELEVRKWQNAVQAHRSNKTKEKSRLREWFVAAVVGMVIGASLYRYSDGLNENKTRIAQFSATEEHVFVNSN